MVTSVAQAGLEPTPICLSLPPTYTTPGNFFPPNDISHMAARQINDCTHIVFLRQGQALNFVSVYEQGDWRTMYIVRSLLHHMDPKD